MLLYLFYLAIIIGLISTFMVVISYNAVHALLYLVVSFLSIALVFYIIGAPFIAALEVIIYAGAIMTLFIFVIMMLNLGSVTVDQEKIWLSPRIWIGPAILSAILTIQFIIINLNLGTQVSTQGIIEPKVVGLSLFTKYLFGVELAGILLIVGVVGAYHLGKKKKQFEHRYFKKEIQ